MPDIILDKWKSNFSTNKQSGIFSSPRSRALNFIVNNNYYEKQPFVLVAAGPSLDKNIEYLKEAQNKCVILCAEVILFKLLDNGITPDYVVTIDPSDQFVRFFKGLTTVGLTYICPTTVNPKVADIWQGNFIFFNQADIAGSDKDIVLSKLRIPGGTGLLNRYFVGATMFQLANIMNASSIALVGYDFAYTDDKAYCDGFLERKIYDDTLPEGSEEQAQQIQKLKDLEITKEAYVMINDTTIFTTQLFNLYKMTLLQLIFKAQKLLFNCTEGGILTEVPQMTLQAYCTTYCTQPIAKTTEFKIRKRRRR